MVSLKPTTDTFRKHGCRPATLCQSWIDHPTYDYGSVQDPVYVCHCYWLRGRYEGVKLVSGRVFPHASISLALYVGDRFAQLEYFQEAFASPVVQSFGWILRGKLVHCWMRSTTFSHLNTMIQLKGFGISLGIWRSPGCVRGRNEKPSCGQSQVLLVVEESLKIVLWYITLNSCSMNDYSSRSHTILTVHVISEMQVYYPNWNLI